MLVVHPEDETTAMLSVLYQGIENVRVFTQSSDNAEIKRRLNHTPPHERIMLLGHGSDKGLFSRNADGNGCFDRLVINHSHAWYLRRHGGDIVAVWCNADLFARNEGLHGLFTGMIISEMEEAQAYGIPTSPEELARETVKLASRLRSLLDMKIPMCEIPARMLELDDVHTPLTEFNYRNFHYL